MCENHSADIGIFTFKLNVIVFYIVIYVNVFNLTEEKTLHLQHKIKLLYLFASNWSGRRKRHQQKPTRKTKHKWQFLRLKCNSLCKLLHKFSAYFVLTFAYAEYRNRLHLLLFIVNYFSPKCLKYMWIEWWCCVLLSTKQ